jgi:hypothetical protein
MHLQIYYPRTCKAPSRGSYTKTQLPAVFDERSTTSVQRYTKQPKEIKIEKSVSCSNLVHKPVADSFFLNGKTFPLIGAYFNYGGKPLRTEIASKS